MKVGVAIGQGKAKALVGNRILGVAAVEVVARELRAVAEILLARPAIATLSVGPAEPGNPDSPVLTDDRADDLMTENKRQLRMGQLPVGDVEIGAAYPADVYLHQYLPRTWPRLRQRGLSQGALRRI
jgi:hypothetical protein